MQVREIEDYVLLKSEKGLDKEVQKYIALGFEKTSVETFSLKLGETFYVGMTKYKKD